MSRAGGVGEAGKARPGWSFALQQLEMSGALPGTGFASRVMDEVVYPLATAPAARASDSPDTTAGGKPHG